MKRHGNIPRRRSGAPAKRRATKTDLAKELEAFAREIHQMYGKNCLTK